MPLQVWLLCHATCDGLLHRRSASVRPEQNEHGVEVEAAGSYIPAGVHITMVPRF